MNLSIRAATPTGTITATATAPPPIRTLWLRNPSAAVTWALLALTWIVGFSPRPARAEDAVDPKSRGREVVIVYNTAAAPESEKLAKHYARQRGVPERQIIGLRLDTTENVPRERFRRELQEPLLKELQARGLLRFEDRKFPDSPVPDQLFRVPVQGAFRYLVLCRGVPLRILADDSIQEADTESIPKHLRRNDAAVDSELALLTLDPKQHRLTGVLRNPAFAVTNTALIHPTNLVTLVARLDGPSADVAQGLVDKAIQAETTGLWGRAFFDARGLTNGGYKMGDDWMLQSGSITRGAGFETLVDVRPETFRASFPMPQIALYGGWYDVQVSGPFTRPHVEFMPGAIAYHLFSFSASTVRAPTSWVGALLAEGATATFGYVAEPYLEHTVNLGLFYELLVKYSFTLGEAVYAAQRGLSWQTTVVGDPLYQPFRRSAASWREELERRRSPLLEWAVLRELNLRLVAEEPLATAAEWLRTQPALAQSAVLRQKLGDLYVLQNLLDRAAPEYAAALKLKPSPAERIHLQWGTARLLNAAGHPAEGIGYFEEFFHENPEYPDLLALHKEALAIAEKAGRADLVAQHQQQVERLAPHPPTASPSASPSAPAK